MENKTHTLVLSDFHLGSKVSRSQEAAELLKNFAFEKLILLGDVFDDLNFNHLKESDWKFLSAISDISKKKKVIWVEGNHDSGLTKVFGILTGIRVRKSYQWKYDEKKYLAIHGHQFDNFLVDNALISVLATWIYNFIQVVDFADKRISRFVKRKSKGWLRLSEKVASRAILYAKFLQADYVFCGHTHKAMKRKSGSVSYYNCGCWTDIPSTYITINKENIRINYHD